MSRHKGRTACAAQKAMSALPPKADMCSALDYVCFGPIAGTKVRYPITTPVSHNTDGSDTGPGF
jgi:hypothetical protein